MGTDCKVVAVSLKNNKHYIIQLHVAAANGYLELTKVLIDYNTNFNIQDNDGWTPMHAASCWCQVSLLLQISLRRNLCVIRVFKENGVA